MQQLFLRGGPTATTANTALQKSNFALTSQISAFLNYHQISLNLDYFLQRLGNSIQTTVHLLQAVEQKHLPYLPRYCVIVSIEWRIPADLHMEYPG